MLSLRSRIRAPFTGECWHDTTAGRQLRGLGQDRFRRVLPEETTDTGQDGLRAIGPETADAASFQRLAVLCPSHSLSLALGSRQ